MGIFSSKKVIEVDNVLYNMAGPEEDRPNYLKASLFNSVMSNSSSIATDIVRDYMNGPGIKHRRFFNYAVEEQLAGLPDVTITNNFAIDPDLVKDHIPVPVSPAGLQVEIQDAYLNEGELDTFIRKWILENLPPNKVKLDYLGNYEPSTDMFSVQFPLGEYHEWPNTIGYAPDARFITATYFLYKATSTGPWNNGSPQSVNTKANLTGFTLTSSGGQGPVQETLNRDAHFYETFSDGRPDNDYTTQTTITRWRNRGTEVYTKTSLTGVDGYTTEGLEERYTYVGTDYVDNNHYFQETYTEDVGGGVTKTVVRTVTGERIVERWDETYDTRPLYESEVHGHERIFIYKLFTGNPALNTVIQNVDTTGMREFFPFIPLRINNRSIRHSTYRNNGLYEETAKAFKRATDRNNIDDFLDELEENENIDDIDYAHIMYGVSLNTKENSAKKYIYRFFDALRFYQNSGSNNAMATFRNNLDNYEDALQALQDWEDTYGDSDSGNWGSIPPRPIVPTLEIPPSTTLRLRTSSNKMQSYDVRIKWIDISLINFNGVYSYEDEDGITQTLSKGKLHIRQGGNVHWNQLSGLPVDHNDFDTKELKEGRIRSINIIYQYEENRYRVLQVWGAIHYNYIYGGKAMYYTGPQAMYQDYPSQFVVPLHYPTMRAMGIVDYTQLSTACANILISSYTVTTIKWYQRGWGRVLLIVLVIALAAAIAPGAFAGAGGVLGGNMAIGSMLGLAGTAAIVVGAVANYLAAIIISQVLTWVGTQIFGEKWGALFAAIATFAFTAAMSGMNIMSAEGLLNLGGALANGYAGWVQADIAEMQEIFLKEQEEYEKQMEEINKLLKELGGNDLNFNPLFLTDTSYGNVSRSGTGSYMPETADEYIHRTTMTGSDIVELTHSMVYDFVDIQRTLPRN